MEQANGYKVLRKDTWRNVDYLECDDGIVRVIPTSDAYPEIELLEEYIEFIVKFFNGKAMPAMVDMRTHYITIPTKALKAFASDPRITGIKKAEAILIKSLPNRLAFNFYLKVMKPKKPARMFSNEEDAVEWLSKYK